jgi:S-adenosylmethionine decarboxylase
LSITLLSLSCLTFAAVAVSQDGPLSRWFRKLFGRQPMEIAAPPRIHTNEGWTLIQCDDAEAFEAWLGRDEEGLPRKDGEEPSLGSHLLVELYGCDGRCLEQERTVGEAMREAAVMSEATVVAQSFHEFKPFGVSGAVIIQESHYTIHTWPEHGYAAVDLFYCGGTVRVHKAVEVLRERFRPTRIKFLVVRRGLQSEVRR